MAGLLSFLESIAMHERKPDSPPRKLETTISEVLAISCTKLNLRDAISPDKLSLGIPLQGAGTICKFLRRLARSILSRSTISATVVKRHMISVLEQNRRLWKIVTIILDHTPKSGHLLTDLIEQFFLGLQDLAVHISQPRWQSPEKSKLFQFWGECLVKLVDVSQAKSFELLADEIIAVLDMTAETSSRLPGLGSTVCEKLQPSLESILNQSSVQSTIYTRLQVRNCPTGISS